MGQKLAVRGDLGVARGGKQAFAHVLPAQNRKRALRLELPADFE
jgi:hypothetical protein